MPELPEVEAAAAIARRVLVGRTIADVLIFHPRFARAWTAAARRHGRGRRIDAVTRRGKSQLLHLDDGTTLVVHFRLDGDWVVDAATDAPPAHARWALALRDGRRLVLTDPRALSTVTRHAPGRPPRLALGPEADDPALTGAQLRARLAGRRAPIKQALLDQRILAGLGNIYAAEALWRARIDPRRRAGALDAAEVTRLLRGIRAALADGVAHLGRYRTGARREPWRVYDRAGAACRRCGVRIATLAQGGRTTYWCPGCQR